MEKSGQSFGKMSSFTMHKSAIAVCVATAARGLVLHYAVRTARNHWSREIIDNDNAATD
jgi:hypothetical protein